MDTALVVTGASRRGTVSVSDLGPFAVDMAWHPQKIRDAAPARSCHGHFLDQTNIYYSRFRLPLMCINSALGAVGILRCDVLRRAI